MPSDAALTLVRVILLAAVCPLSASSSSDGRFSNGSQLLKYWDAIARHPPSFRFPEQVELVVAAEEWIPHIGVHQDPRTGEVTISGPMANLLNSLAKALNFRYRLVRPSDGAWGIPRKDGSGDWNGMIGMVKRNEADLAMGPFGLTYSRTQVVSFTSPILIDYYRILVKRQKPQPDPWGWRSPFTWGVWLGFAVALVGVAVTVWANTAVFGITSTKGSQKKAAGELGLWEHMWQIFGSAMSQSMLWVSWSFGGRAILAVWMIIMLVASRSYSSSLTSLLAVRTVATPYNYLVDLVQDPNIVLVFEAATALVEYMSTVKTGIYASLAEQSARSRFVTPPELFEAAYNDVRNSKTALLVEDTTCRKVLSDDFTKYGRCDFYIGKERYWPLIFSMIGKKDHPIMASISARLERLVSHDLYFKWLSAELPNATACLSSAGKVTVREPYRMDGLWGIFLMLAVGLALAALVLLGEVTVGHYGRKASD